MKPGLSNNGVMFNHDLETVKVRAPSITPAGALPTSPPAHLYNRTTDQVSLDENQHIAI